MSDDVRERLADVQHAIWAHWMRYMFTQGTVNPDGSWTMPAEKVTRWGGQMRTPYSDLTERERESDREQADKIILSIRHLLEGAILADVYSERLGLVDRYGADQWRRGNAGKEPQEFEEWRLEQPRA